MRYVGFVFYTLAAANVGAWIQKASGVTDPTTSRNIEEQGYLGTGFLLLVALVCWWTGA